MTKWNKLGAVLAVGLGAIVCFSVAQMSRRVGAYNKMMDFHHFRFQVIMTREFQAYGKPVTLTDESEDGQSYLRLHFADTDMRVPVKTPPAKDMPNLGIYDEWAKVLEVHEVGRSAEGVQGDVVGSGRVVLITRRTPDGYDPETWGSVFRDAWTFDFYELEPDGKVMTSQYRWPRGEMGDMGLKKQVKAGEPRAVALASIPELPGRTWQYQAALHVIPKLNVPKYRFKDTAFKAMGWTLPVAGLGGLGFVAAVCLAFAPGRAKFEEAPTCDPA